DHHNDFGVALLRKGELDEAIAEFRNALREKGGLWLSWEQRTLFGKNLAIALEAKGQRKDAIAALRSIPGYVKDADAHFRLGNLLLRNGELDSALYEFREAIRIKPDDLGTHFNLGNVLLDKGQLDEAIAAYRKAIAIKADAADAHSNLGEALRRKG